LRISDGQYLIPRRPEDRTSSAAPCFSNAKPLPSKWWSAVTVLPVDALFVFLSRFAFTNNQHSLSAGIFISRRSAQVATLNEVKIEFELAPG
jgi:hypothetical protein